MTRTSAVPLGALPMWRTRPGVRLWMAAALAVAGGAGVVLGPAAARQPADPYRPVAPQAHPLDREGVWTLRFEYLPPRIIQVRGKTAWYMTYRVWNDTDSPHEFRPTVELVTKDPPYQTFLDEPRPAVVKEVRRREDPSGTRDIKTSIGIMRDLIPVTRADSFPRYVHGVAVWLDVAEKAPATNNFSVYVTGLSNGVSVPEDGGDRVQRKTLRLDFVRPTDNARNQIGDIRPADNGGLGEFAWVYRDAPVQAKAAGGEEKKDGK